MADQNFRVKRGLEVGIGGTVITATASGSVGIGTTNPQTVFQVLGSGNQRVFSVVDVDANNIRVGIGTTNPEVDLHIRVPNAQIILESTANNNNGSITFRGKTSSGVAHTAVLSARNQGKLDIRTDIGSTGTDASIVFSPRDVEAARFDTNGNLGIGTTNPTAALTIGTAGTTTTGGGQIYLNGATNNRIDFNTNGVAAPTGTTRSDGTKIVLYPSLSALAVDVAFGVENNHLWQSVPTDGSGQGFKWYAGTTQIAILRGDGSLGIATTNPTGGLTIATVGSTTTGASQIYLNGATSNRIDFNTNGIAGPSTSTRSAGTKIVLYPGVSATGVDFGFGIESSTLWSSVGDSTASFKWYAGTTQLAVLNGNGNLGIGTINPTQALHVQGNTLITGIATVNSSLIASSDVTFNTTASNINLGTSQTTGRLILGGPSQTGQITLGFSVSTHTLGIATGASGVGTTKTINLGTGGLSGSNTQINIGPSAGSGVISVGTGVSVGIGTAIFNTLGHGGTNVITQINNTGITTNSQSHLILSSAAAAQANSSVGTISWGLPTASATNKGIAYIAGLTGSGSTTGALSGKLVFATRNTTDSQFAERMVLNESGNVGLGSTLPTAALTIATVGSATTGASQIYLNGGTSNRIDFNQNGVAPPSFTPRSAGTKIVLYPQLGAATVDYAMGTESGHIWQSVSATAANQGFKWYAGTTELAVLKGNGNLGIGTTNPSEQLHLFNTQNNGTSVLVTNNDTGTAALASFRVNAGGTASISLISHGSGRTSSRLGQVLASMNEITSSTGNGILFGTQNATPLILGTNDVEIVRITSSGNVGIGITNPGSELQVAGPAAEIRLTDTTGAIGDLSSTGWLLYQRASNSIESASGFSIKKDSGGDVLTINSSGNLGIGITDPLTLLHLNSTDPTIRLKRSDAATNAYGEITSDTSGLITLKSDPGNVAANSGFSLTVDNTERVRVGSAGSVGIGTNNPTSRLYVLGDLASEYAATFFNDGNNANRFGIRIQCGVDTGSGTAIAINDGDGTNQGNVTFNAGTVTYGAFTANHDCVIPSYSQEIPYGSLMIVNKILYKKRIDGTEMERGIIYESGISTLPYVKNLLGAYSYQYDPDSPMQQAVDLPLHQVLVLGDGHIRCCNENGNIKIGDGITSSSMEGVGMKMNKIGMVIGIAQEDVDFTDANEVKLVPVQYGLHQYIPDNISEYLETLIN